MTALGALVSVWRPSPVLARAVRFRLTPTEGQEEYLGVYHPIVLDIASNRRGKTTGAIWDDIWRAHGVHPYKNVPLIDTLWLACPDEKFFEKVTGKILFEELPRNLFIDFNQKLMRVRVRRVDGGTCSIYCVTYQQDVQSLMGAAVGHVHADELPPEEHFREYAARVSTTKGTIGITVTPVQGLDWMEEELYLPGKSGERPDVMVLEGGVAEYDEAKERADPYTCGVGRLLMPPSHPMGDREVVEQFARSIKDPAERMVRVFGIYRKRSGGVYKDFDAQVHVVPSFQIPEHFEIVGGCDPGFNGFACVLDAIDPLGRAYTFLEYFNQGGTHDTHVADLWKMLVGDPDNPADRGLLPFLRYTPEQIALMEEMGGESPRQVLIYVDTAAPQDVLELNAAVARLEGCRLVFLQIDQKLKGVSAGIRHVEAMLAPSMRRARPQQVERPLGYEMGEPLWYLFDTLYSEWMLPPKSGVVGDEGTPMSGSRLAWELKNYKWKKPTLNQAHSVEPDKASAGGAHVLDAKRYAAMSRTAPPDPPDEHKDETPQQHRARKHRERLAAQSKRRRR